MQLTATAVADVDAELRKRLARLPGVDNPRSVIGGGADTALWLNADMQLKGATITSREFGHIHPDGSLHAVLPYERAQEMNDKKWGEFHPWAGSNMFEGLVMFYTPQSFDELKWTWQLVVDSTNFASGQNLNADEIAAGR